MSDIQQFVVDEELKATLEVTDKGEIKITAAQMKDAAKRQGIDIAEVNEMQKKVNNFTGVIANTAGQFAVDYFVENPESHQIKSSWVIGQTRPTLTTDREAQQANSITDASLGHKTIHGRSRLDMKKSMPDNFRKDIQRGIQTYAETKLGDIKTKK